MINFDHTLSAMTTGKSFEFKYCVSLLFKKNVQQGSQNVRSEI